jgi:trehalose 6-phosphate phosphatase
MKDILAPRNVPILADFACSSVLLAFDYDGTLAPIASTPARARMRRATRRLLSQVARRYPCVVISGRTRADLRTRLGGVPLWQIFGNHGLEPWALPEGAARAVRAWVRHLREVLAEYPGVVIEDKKYSATIHYRNARVKAEVRRAIARAVAALDNVRVVAGTQAVNLLPSAAGDKGIALQRARRELACDTAIYVGDDGTDEDAFRSAPPVQLLGIRVGRARRSRAHYRLRTQEDIDRLLQALLTFRARASRRDALTRRGLARGASTVAGAVFTGCRD